MNMHTHNMQHSLTHSLGYSLSINNWSVATVEIVTFICGLYICECFVWWDEYIYIKNMRYQEPKIVRLGWCRIHVHIHIRPRQCTNISDNSKLKCCIKINSSIVRFMTLYPVSCLNCCPHSFLFFQWIDLKLFRFSLQEPIRNIIFPLLPYIQHLFAVRLHSIWTFVLYSFSSLFLYTDSFSSKLRLSTEIRYRNREPSHRRPIKGIDQIIADIRQYTSHGFDWWKNDCIDETATMWTTGRSKCTRFLCNESFEATHSTLCDSRAKMDKHQPNMEVSQDTLILYTYL